MNDECTLSTFSGRICLVCSVLCDKSIRHTGKELAQATMKLSKIKKQLQKNANVYTILHDQEQQTIGRFRTNEM